MYQSEEGQERLMGLYQELHSRLHHSTRPLLSIYRCGETENFMAWVSLPLPLTMPSLRCVSVCFWNSVEKLSIIFVKLYTMIM